MPWRTAPHFSITRQTSAGERDREAALEKSMEREGMVRLGLGLGFGSGFLRWCSLMRD